MKFNGSKSDGQSILDVYKETCAASKSRITGIVGISVGLLFAVIILFTCTSRIDPGYAGVIYNMDGGIEGETLNQGFHIIAPWKHVTSYPVSTETVYYTKGGEGEKTDRSINVNTKDGKQVNVSVTYAYHMDVEMLPSVFEKFRGQKIEVIEAGYMKNSMFEAVNNVTSQYSLMELVGDKRPEVNNKIFEAFRMSLAPYGIIIETFNLSDVVPDSATAEAIQRVVNAQNQLEQAKIEKERTEVEAETARIKARGESDALIIQAEGQASANYKLQQSLTQNVIEQRRIEKWNGELPKIVGGNGIIVGADLIK